ncbi:MAG: hypothetical protein J6S85_23580 [Methanobrevibacter sp.]|nr:hypothetical protein [Methanobrevibacter sp.]
MPTDDSRMMFQERELDGNEGSLTDAQFETIKSFLISQRERFSSRGYEELIRNIMITDPNRFARAIRYVLDNKKKYMTQVYDLYVIVQKEREIWQAIINNSKNGKILGEPFTKNYWETYETIDSIYKDLKDTV